MTEEARLTLERFLSPEDLGKALDNEIQRDHIRVMLGLAPVTLVSKEEISHVRSHLAMAREGLNFSNKMAGYHHWRDTLDAITEVHDTVLELLRKMERQNG